MADPTVIECASACTVTLVHEFASPLFDLSMQDAASIGGAVLLVWAVGFGFRVLIRALQVDENPGKEIE